MFAISPIEARKYEALEDTFNRQPNQSQRSQHAHEAAWGGHCACASSVSNDGNMVGILVIHNRGRTKLGTPNPVHHAGTCEIYTRLDMDYTLGKAGG